MSSCPTNVACHAGYAGTNPVHRNEAQRLRGLFQRCGSPLSLQIPPISCLQQPSQEGQPQMQHRSGCWLVGPLAKCSSLTNHSSFSNGAMPTRRGSFFFFQPAKKSCCAKARTRLNRAVFFSCPPAKLFFPPPPPLLFNDTRLNRLCSCRLLLLKSS